MASGASVKLGVEGISQFKNNMNQAKQAVKTLDAQLTLTEKQFKASGDAESYMTEKAELLKAKLEQQKTVLANAEKALKDMTDRGVDRASKAYQDMYRQMVSAKGAILDTQTQMDNMTTSTDEAASGVSEMNSQLSNIGKGVGWQNVTEGFDKITAGVEKAAKKVWGFGKQVVSTMLDAGSWADDLQTRADYFMMTPEELQRAQKTATLIDTSVESIVGAQRKLKRGLWKEDAEAFGAIVDLMGDGYDPTMKNWEDVFWDAGEALMRFTDEEKQEVYAQKLFGKSWNELIPLFKTGRAEYEKMNESWSVVSQDSIDKLQDMQNEYDKLMANWETFKYEALAQFATPMRQALEIVNEQLGKVQDWLKSEEGQAFVENILKAITDGMKWIVEHKEDVVEALKWIVVGWAGIRLTGGALGILQLINGVKNLHLFKNNNPTTPTGTPTGTPTTTGGFWTGIGNKITGLASKGSAFITSQGLLPGVVGDMFLNQTNTGRALRDGTDVLEGVQADLEEKANEIKQNAETFEEDWKNNEIVKFFTQRNDNADAATRLSTGADWRPSYMRGTANNYYNPNMVQFQNAAEKMEEAASELTGNNDVSRQSSSDMSSAAGTLKGMPGQVEEAILRGMSKIRIFIDGQQAGGVLTPYVNNKLGDLINTLVK